MSWTYPGDTREAQQIEDEAGWHGHPNPFVGQEFWERIGQAGGEHLYRLQSQLELGLQQRSGVYQHGRQVEGSPMPVNWESSPTVKSMKKNKMDHSGDTGSLERASGYAMKAKPNPANTRGKNPTALDNPAHRLFDRRPHAWELIYMQV